MRDERAHLRSVAEQPGDDVRLSESSEPSRSTSSTPIVPALRREQTLRPCGGAAIAQGVTAGGSAPSGVRGGGSRVRRIGAPPLGSVVPWLFAVGTILLAPNLDFRATADGAGTTLGSESQSTPGVVAHGVEPSVPESTSGVSADPTSTGPRGVNEELAGAMVGDASALAEDARRADTKLVVDDGERDLGETLRGGGLSVEIALRNDGAGPRTLRVRGSCGCIVVKAPATIPPGETISIAVTVDSARLLPGPHRKSLLLTTDDPVRPRIKIPLLWHVRGLMEPTTGSRLAVRGVHHAPVEATLELRAGSELTEEVTAVRSVQGRFTVLGFEADGPRLRVSVAVPAAAKALRTTDLLALDVRCTDGQTRRCDLPVDIELLERIGFRPARNVAFRKSETRRLLTGRPVERRIHLKSNDPAIRFEVTEWSVEGDGEAFRVAMKPIKPGEEVAFSIQLVKYLDRNAARARLVIRTNDPKEPIKRLPLHAQFEPGGPVRR